MDMVSISDYREISGNKAYYRFLDILYLSGDVSSNPESHVDSLRMIR